MSADDDDITEELLADAGKLTGLSLELLGLDPHPDDMTAEQRLQFDPEDLAEMAAVAPEDRRTAVHQTRLLAGLLWNSASILIDQLFRDLGTLSALETITPSDIAGSSVLSSLPPQFAASYDAKFTQKFIVVAADVTASLGPRLDRPRVPRGGTRRPLPARTRRKSPRTSTNWTFPRSWRADVEEVLLEDADSEALFSDSLDVLEDDADQLDFGQWFKPFGPGATRVPPYACS